jgi:glycosyltransferase involved in cell wall biosynthesis
MTSHPSAHPDDIPEGPLVSVIVPAYNAAPTIDLCLDAVAASDYGHFEVLVVFDGPAEQSAGIAKSREVRVIENKIRQGAAYTRNVGAAAARGEIFFFVDADCILARDAISIAVRALRDGDHAIFGSYRSETRAPGFFSRFKNYQHHFTHQKGAPLQTSFWSGCGAITRQAFEAVNGFDVELQALEDVELGYELSRWGYPIRLVKNMRAEHLKVYSLSRLIKSDLFARAIPWTRLVLSGRSELGKLNTGKRGKRSVSLTGLALGAIPIEPLAALALYLAVCALNVPLLRFIAERRGLGFAAASSFSLIMHFAICGVGFIVGHFLARYPAGRTPPPEYDYTEIPAQPETREPVAVGDP